MKRSSTDSDSAAVVADKREKMDDEADEAEEDLWQHLPFWGSDCCDTDELMELIQDTSVSGVDQCSVFADIYNDGDYSIATEQLIELFDPFPDEDVSAGEPRFFARIYNDDTGATEQVIELEDPFSSDDDSDSSELYQLKPVETAESTLQKKKVR